MFVYKRKSSHSVRGWVMLVSSILDEVEKATSRLAGRAKTQKGLALQPCVIVENQERGLSCRGTL